MSNNLTKSLQFLMFLFAAEDSNQWHGGPHLHTAQNEIANIVKYLFWFTMSIVMALIFSQLF